MTKFTPVLGMMSGFATLMLIFFFSNALTALPDFLLSITGPVLYAGLSAFGLSWIAPHKQSIIITAIALPITCFSIWHLILFFEDSNQSHLWFGVAAIFVTALAMGGSDKAVLLKRKQKAA